MRTANGDKSAQTNQYRRVVCKYIYAVKYWIALREKIGSEGAFRLKEELTEKPTCPYAALQKLLRTVGKRSGRGSYAANATGHSWPRKPLRRPSKTQDGLLSVRPLL